MKKGHVKRLCQALGLPEESAAGSSSASAVPAAAAPATSVSAAACVPEHSQHRMFPHRNLQRPTKKLRPTCTRCSFASASRRVWVLRPPQSAVPPAQLHGAEQSGRSGSSIGVYSRPAPRDYTACYTGILLYNARNGPIQQTFPVPRACRYTARPYTVALYSIQRIHYTALYTDPLGGQ